MPQVKNIELAKKEMFTPEAELRERYDDTRVAHLLRLRDMYNYVLANPSSRDKDFINHFKGAYGLSLSRLYADLALTKELLPALMPESRESWRKRVSDMLLETYNMAKARKDTKTMERAASSLGKVNRVDLEDEKEFPFDLIVIQAFTPSSDPSLVGCKPIPNVEEVKARLRKKLAADNPDIEDIDYEEADLEEAQLFPGEVNNEAK